MKNIHPKRLGPYACPKKECEKWLDSGKYLVLQLNQFPRYISFIFSSYFDRLFSLTTHERP